MKGHHVEVTGGKLRALERAGLVERAEYSVRVYAGVDLRGAAREEDLRREPDRAGELPGVGRAELVGDARPAPAPGAHAAGGLVRDERPEGAEPRVARHDLLVGAPDAGEDGRLHRGRHELTLDEDTLTREVMDVVRLRDFFPAADVLLE